MIEPKSFTEMILYATVLIETDKEGGEGRGTGFLFEAELKHGFNVQWLVTNKHVIRGAKEGTLRLHLARSRDDFTPSGQTAAFRISDFETVWIDHPDKSIDISVMCLGGLIHAWQQQGKCLYYRTVDSSLVWPQTQLESLTTVEDVLMVGYPEGLVDTVHYLPVVRSGATASHPAVDFQGRPDGLIDLACFPGSSGSPIFLYNPSLYFDKHKMTTIPSARGALLGLLYAGPRSPTEGQVLTGRSIRGIRVAPVRTETLTMMHLGQYVKAREIVVAIHHARAKVLEEHDK